MNKIIYAFAALALAGCAKSQITDEAPKRETSDADHIRLAPTTTRVGISTLDELQNDAQGFKVWAYAPNEKVWYSDGNSAPDPTDGHYFHKYTDGAWNFATPMAWPGTASAAGANAGYPLDFYAIYPNVETRELNMTMTQATLDPLSIWTFFYFGMGVETRDPSANDFPDVMVGKVTGVQARPASSTLSMEFRHIFSKVDFAVDASTDYTAHVQALGLKNLKGHTGAYDIISQVWTLDPGDGTTNSSSPNYYGRFPNKTIPADGVLPAREFTGDDTPQPFYPDNHLMLIPQNNNDTMWDPSSGKDPNPEIVVDYLDTHIQMTYRLREEGVDVVGFSTAASHPDWRTGDYTGPLFVRAGWPFDGNWEQGKGYTYNIELPGETGGNLVDTFYYDETGEMTDFAVAGKKIGDPVIGDVSGGYIRLPSVADDWDAPSAQVLQ